jgi:hypothetical protein
MLMGKGVLWSTDQRAAISRHAFDGFRFDRSYPRNSVRMQMWLNSRRLQSRAQSRMDAREDLIEAVWLREEVLNLDQIGRSPSLTQSTGCYQKAGFRVVLAYPGTKSEPIHLSRHLHVREHQVYPGPAAGKMVDGLLRVARLDDGQPGILEAVSDDNPQHGLVLDEENPRPCTNANCVHECPCQSYNSQLR